MINWLDLAALPNRRLLARHRGVVFVHLVKAFLVAEVLPRLAKVVVHPVMEAPHPGVEDCPDHCAHRALRLLRKDYARGLRLIGG